MRRGYSLVEVMVVLVLLMVVANVLAGAFRTAAWDIPRAYRVIGANTIVLNLLRQIEEDVEAGRSLPASFGKLQQGDNVLLIESGGQVVCYEKGDDGRITRLIVGGDEGASKEGDVMKWEAPGARVRWDVVEQNGVLAAVEVRSHIEHKALGNIQRKLKGAHLFFVGAAREALR